MHENIFSVSDLIQYGLVLLALYAVYRKGINDGVMLGLSSLGIENQEDYQARLDASEEESKEVEKEDEKQ